MNTLYRSYYAVWWDDSDDDHINSLSLRPLAIALPHGSGFNSDWYIARSGKDGIDAWRVVCSTVYDTMDEDGFYDDQIAVYIVYELRAEDNTNWRWQLIDANCNDDSLADYAYSLCVEQVWLDIPVSAVPHEYKCIANS